RWAVLKRWLPPRRYRWSYIAALASLALPVAVLPAGGLFKVAFEERLALLTKHRQFDLAQSLVERSVRVKQELFSVQGINPTTTLDGILSVSAAAPRRDVYELEDFATEVAPIECD